MKRALVVIDYQNDFVSGSLGFKAAEKLEPIIVKKLLKAAQLGNKIIFTRDTHQQNYLQTQEGKKLAILHCIRNTEGWQFYGKIKELATTLPGTLIIEKYSFGSLELGDVLKRGQYKEIEFVGLVSNICVISNVIIAKAALPEAIIKVSATASYDEKLNKEALDIMKGLQIEISS